MYVSERNNIAAVCLCLSTGWLAVVLCVVRATPEKLIVNLFFFYLIIIIISSVLRVRESIICCTLVLLLLLVLRFLFRFYSIFTFYVFLRREHNYISHAHTTTVSPQHSRHTNTRRRRSSS